ncbi:hydrocephalus-inducing protein homolog isoform X1 [Scleropages formosus]|uniref:hydrocephalus-inducing protein homolog isoform X1 n=2 Tax=Scleropages formosus TaxID=113540 RepID=UPI0010FA8E99|nr:hydrocephalus-inducing protein homolog isoform X1 [Scleropages formosus]
MTAIHAILATHYSSGPCKYHLRLTNRGRRFHQLYWMTEGFPPFCRRALQPSHSNSSRGDRRCESDGPAFIIEPPYVELAPGQTADMVLVGFSNTSVVVQERLLCQAILGQKGGKERIMTVDVTCKFVSPVLKFSSQELSFCAEKTLGVSLVPLYQPLVLTNVSSLPLSMELALVKPFGLCDHPEDPSFVTSKIQTLGVGQDVKLWVCFNSLHWQDHVTHVVEEKLEVHYQDHPQRDSIILRGEVRFPNLRFSSTSLDFGCIFNHTESQKQLTMTNCSRLAVTYHWAFLVEQVWYHISFPQEADTSVKQTPADSKVDRPEMRNADGKKEPHSQRLRQFDQKHGNSKRRSQTSPHQQDSKGPPSKQHKSNFIQTRKERSSLGVEEVFDILPMSGELQPGESQHVCFTFYGHANISGQVLALCEVEEGPTYEIALKGEASQVTYTLDRMEIDLGVQLFDRVAETELILRNTGKVGFDFSVQTLEGLSPTSLPAGLPLVVPNSGHIEANKEQKLAVYYLPGVPEVFHKSFELQVSYYEPESITLTGEGIFPRICLDLPRCLDEEKYTSVLQEARELLEKETRPVMRGGDLSADNYIPTYDTLLQMEMERLLVKKVTEGPLASPAACGDTSTPKVNGHCRKISRLVLPEYMLDFGYVIRNSVQTHTVKVTNTGPLPVSFWADQRHLACSGFSTELDKVKNLPSGETETFEVKFDPRGASLDLGEAVSLFPIRIVGGPVVQVRLRATVTMPSLSVSTDTLQFGTIQCGLCKVVTVQLLNPESVPSEWTISEEQQAKKKIDKHVPLHIRRRMWQERKPVPIVFEILPPSGVLLPGERVNVQVKFTPAEGKTYSQPLVLSVAQSSQRVLLLAQGQGEEPQLEFSSSVLELAPILPYSRGEEGEVLVRNPCSFPVEFYSLEFDKQYLEEEKILCMMKGYDAKNILLLPPRAPGETLPPELLDYYKKQSAQEQEDLHVAEMKSLKERETLEAEEKAIASLQAEVMAQPLPLGSQSEDDRKETKGQSSSGEDQAEDQDDSGGTISVGELEIDPVARAIARYMGTDLLPGGQAVQNRKGIAIIVHGAPLSGKTETSVTLAKYYGAACLNIDAVVLEAVTSGESTAALRAKELCAKATLEHSQRRLEEAAQDAPEMTVPLGTADDALGVDVLVRDSAEGDETQPAMASQGLPPGQVPKQLSGSSTGDLGLVSCVLPEELLVDILTDRLQLSDCHCGVVIDGLDTVYSHSPAKALQAVLKAFNNRCFIYVINLVQTFEAFQAKEKAQREAEENQQREIEEMERMRLQEMDEEEYDALPEEEKKRFALKHLEDLKKHKEQERMEREQEERRCQEEQERLREEEDVKKKNKKVRKEPQKEDAPGKKSQLGGKQSATALKSESKLDLPLKEVKKMPFSADSKEPKESLEEGAREPEDGNKRKPKEGKGAGQEELLMSSEDPDRELGQCSESAKLLQARFQEYEQNQALVRHIVEYWNRTQGQLLQALLPEELLLEGEDTTPAVPERQVPSGKRAKKEREKEKVEKERERLEKEKFRMDSTDPKLAPLTGSTELTVTGGDALEGAEKEALPEKVPYLLLPVSGRDHSSGTEILQTGKLPTVEEVLDELGLGPKGPPIPPPTIFSVVPYPQKRPVLSDQQLTGCFTFMVPAAEEPGEGIREDMDLLGSTSFPASLSKMPKEDQVPSSKGRGKKADAGKESQKEKRRTGKKGKRGTESPPLSTVTAMSDTESQLERSQKLTTFRWIVPPNGQVTLKIWFHSLLLGKFEQTLNFEVMGTKRHYQLVCKGVCAYPSISQDYKTMFTHCRKALFPENSLPKTYIISTGVYDFGPLLCGKNRDRYKERKYPENGVALVIHNNSPIDTEVHFCFKNDTKAMTFMLDPSSMTLKPNERQELTVWAYPTSPGLVEDSVICCVKENPESIVIRFSCQGVRPELELDRKQLHFDKVLLNRRVTKTLCLRNSTLLPVAWRLSLLDSLGEEFGVSQDQGVILPQAEYNLQVHFRATRPVIMKKAIRLEVLDSENILGIVHTENIQVLAEAYDVAFDITFPKGTSLSSQKSDGALDFGTVKVSEEVKLSLTLKNKGKYEVVFKFVLDPTDQTIPDLNSLFTIMPPKGSLHPSDRPTNVQFVFHHDKEICIKEQPIILLQVIEPNITAGGEIIGLMPIKVSIQSLFTKYSIQPSTDINFGPLVCGSRKSYTFTIENCGEFEMRFNISRMSKDMPLSVQRKGGGVVKRSRSRESHSTKTVTGSKIHRTESIQKDVGQPTQARLTMGVFSLSPGFGILVPGAHQAVTVECAADQLGSWEECLAVDITDRDPTDHPNGIPCRLAAEVCMPGILHKDIASIFEEHHICKNSNLLSCEPFKDALGIYIQDENKFVFNNVLVGRPAKARFRITNPGKVPCELSLAIKSVPTKMSVRAGDAFEVTPARVCIPSHSHTFVEVVFAPQSMQTYSAIFEVTLEGCVSWVPVAKTKALAFELAGDGNLPRAAVLRPLLRTPRGNPLLQFKRLLVGQSQVLALVLKNDGTVPAQINIDLLDQTGVFTLKEASGTVSSSVSPPRTESESDAERKVEHETTLCLTVGQQVEIHMEFRPMAEQVFEAQVRLLVTDNQYEETVVQLVGEGYRDVVTLDNIGGKAHAEDSGTTVEGLRSDILHLGDCHVARPYQDTFTMTNHSSSDVLRFEWPPDGPQLRFFPRVGHLHAGCSKDVTVTLCSEQPVVLNAQLVKCKLCRVVFQQPVDQVPDWDDRLRTVKWVDAGKQVATPRPSKKKVIEPDPEPAHSVVENSSRELELRVSAVCDYAKFTCKAENICFKDTLLYQTRVYQFQIQNSGSVQLEFSWQVLMERLGMNNSFTCKATSQPVTPRSRQESRTAPRPATALGSVSNLLMGDPELPPFSVEPSTGNINPGDSLTFHIKFSPLEVAEYEGRLMCSIPNLKEEQGPTMAVSGRSLLPYCHFHLEDSDYLSAGRRNPDMRGSYGAPTKATLDPSTRVIEFTAVGIGTSVPRTFSMVNPTSKPYSFVWRCEDLGETSFKCITPKGSIQPGKKAEVTFEFQAHDLDMVESFWTFLIPEQGISVPFLLAGIASEPKVYMDRVHLNLGSLLVGRRIQEMVYIVNGEDIPYRFSIRETSRHAEAFLDSLELDTLVGTVRPHERFPVTISFTPNQEGTVSFSLVCDVRSKMQPLTLNVKAECHSLSACVQCQGPDGDITELSPGITHQVDFKQVELSDRSLCQFLLSNPCKFCLDVQYELLGPPEFQRHLQVDPVRDCVPVGQQSQCTVTFLPLKKCVIKDVILSLSVKNGPTFSCSFSGCAVAPSVHFSFLKHNFGMSFLYSAGMVPPSQTLVISNRGKQTLSLGCLFHNTAHLEVGFQPEMLPPGGAAEVPITFYARKVMHYKEKIVFEINECTRQVVEILGQGIKMKIEVENPKQKVVNLGALQIGQRTKTVVPVVNNSPAPLTVCLLFSPSVHTLLDPKVFSVSPTGEVTLKASGGRCLLELLFSPKQHMAPFREELQLECLGTVCPLLVLQGCCHGVEVMLDQTCLPFGAVAKGGQASRRVVMSNTGDMGARFKWDTKKFSPDFSISPTEGYICPGMVIPFDVTFSPVELSQDIRYENVPCTIEGAKPIRLTVSGSCVMPLVTKEVVNFVCQVRSQQSQTITLSNRTGQRWSLKPELEGEHWSAPSSLVIEPFQLNKPFEIIYKPLVMTADGKKHQGSVFFSFPDGTATQYTLLGISEPPKAAGTIFREMPCKTPYTELLPAHNWLAKLQRFRVVAEIIKTEHPDSTVSLKGLDYLDVPALTKRDYKLSFFTYKEGLYNARVTFRNEVTQEYQFYYLNFKATAPGVIRTIEMATPLRQTASATVEVENPLSVTVSFTVECRSADISVPSLLSVPAMSTGTLTFEYQPLRVGDFATRLSLHNVDLGYFHYDLVLKALPAPPEKPLFFRAPLGSGQYGTAKFVNYSRIKTEYICKTDSPDFTVEKSISVSAGNQAGIEVSVEVHFEPCQLGESRATLTITSGPGGEYVFPLIGTSVPPKAQGPFPVRMGTSISIPFKNVFLQATAFSFQVDNPAFTVKGVETVRSKKSLNVLVSYEGSATGSHGPCTGKLTIFSPRTEGHGQSISWIYYLKGISHELSQRDKPS